MFQTIKSAARRFFQGFLKGLRKTGKGTLKFMDAVAEANDSVVVKQVEAAESRIEQRGTFGNVLGIMFGAEEVTRDIAIVRDRQAYATYVKDRRAGKPDAYATYVATRRDRSYGSPLFV